MATQTQGLQVQLSVSGMASVDAAFKRMQMGVASFHNTLKAATGVVIAAAGLKGIADTTKSVLSMGRELTDLKARAGATIPELMAMGKLLKENGGSADDTSTQLAKMQKSIVDAAEQGGSAARIFEQLKLDVSKLSGMRAGEQYRAIGEAIASIENPAKRTQAAMEIFGRSAAQTAGMFKSVKSFREAFENPSAFTTVMSRNAEMFADMDRSLEKFAGNGKKLIAGVLDQIAPLFEDTFKKLGSIDLTETGQKIGSFFGVVIQSWRDDKFPEMIGLLVQAGFEIGFSGAAKFFGNDAFPTLGASFLNFAMTFGVKVTEALLNAFKYAAAGFSATLNFMVDHGSAAFEHLGAVIKSAFGTALNWVIEKLNVSLSYWTDAFNKLSGRFGAKPATAPQIPKVDDRVDLTRIAYKTWGEFFDESLERGDSTVGLLVKKLEQRLKESRLALNIGFTSGSALTELVRMMNAFRAQRDALGAGSGGNAGGGNFNAIISGAALNGLLNSELMLKSKLVDIEAQRAKIDTDYTLTSTEKYEARKQLLLEEKATLEKIVAAMERRAKIEEGIDPQKAEQIRSQIPGFQKQVVGKDREIGAMGPDPKSFTESMSAAWTKIREMGEITWKRIADTFTDVFSTAISSVSNGITGVIMGTERWGQALMNIGRTILTSIIGSIVQMGVSWVVTHVLMKGVSFAFHALISALGWARAAEAPAQAATAGATSLAATAPIAAAQALIWTTPATLATIASYGSAAVAAPGFIAAADALVAVMSAATFSEGGFTGPGGKYDVAGIVHRGEFVMPAHAVSRIGVGNLEAMRHGNIQQVSQVGSVGQPNVAFFDDRQAMQQWLDSVQGEKQIIRINSRHRGKY